MLFMPDGPGAVSLSLLIAAFISSFVGGLAASWMVG